MGTKYCPKCGAALGTSLTSCHCGWKAEMTDAPLRIWAMLDTSGVSHEWAAGWYQGRQSERFHTE